ncbi:hypothetical protein VNI00_017491 [Paramarasmius palmivorus]|uniref:Uncharacterized protein n=1 Tax=Paramarasmius palmivorus TaxID=297713 RepID=A0AAW0B527_9AGAR
MPKASATDESDQIPHPQNSLKVACRACNELDDRDEAQYSWQTKGNWKRHLATIGHIRALEERAKRQDTDRQRTESYASIYARRNFPAPLSHPPLETLIRPPPAPRQDTEMPLGMEDFAMTDAEIHAYYPVLPSEEEKAEEQREVLEAEIKLLREQLFEEMCLREDELDINEDGTEAEVLADSIREMDILDSGNDEDNMFEAMHGVPKQHRYFPYPTKTLKVIIWLMKETGAHDVPSFSQLRNMQKTLQKTSAVSTTTTTSDFGNVFSTNDVRDFVARDFANPIIAENLHLYMEDTAGHPISEVWQIPGGRWSELPQDLLPPSIYINSKRYYIHELAERQDGKWFIPQLWITQRNTLYAECILANKTIIEGSVCVQITSTWERVPVSDFRANHEDIERQFPRITFAAGSENYAAKIPNVNRQIDGGEDLYTVFFSIWTDDVSGARTKQYQKHMNVCGENVNIPGRLLQQEYFVRALSTSPHAGSLEQLKVILQQIKSTHVVPVRTLNAVTKRPCRFRIYVPELDGDNPMQSEEASHMGHTANCRCRACMAGGTAGFVASKDTYKEFYSPGKLRNVEEIKQCVLEQIRIATTGIQSHVDKLQTATGTKDKIAQHWIDLLIEKARQVKDSYPEKTQAEITTELLEWLSNQTDQPFNPLLDFPYLDPSQDTLVEILHTILLGVEKYGWHNLHSNWDDKKKETFGIRLQSTDIHGLNIAPIRAEYMMQYCNALIGKHFRVLIQVSTFHLHDLVSEEQFRLIRALGELGAVLWIAEIDDMKEYLDDLTILIDNVLDAFSDIDPFRILKKIKLHALVHLPEQIRRRGPAVRFSSEIYECYNAVFRMCSILSNHQAASRDIALKLASLDRVKHMISGGYWLQDGDWVRAGEEVRSILTAMPVIQKHLGWTPVDAWTPGTIRAVAMQKATRSRPEVYASNAGIVAARDPSQLKIPPHSSWVAGTKVTAVNGDECKIGTWAVFRWTQMDSSHAASEQAFVGRISALYLPSNAGSEAVGVILVEEFEVGEVPHFRFNMPVLSPIYDNNIKRIIVLKSSALQFAVNVQHDCGNAGCSADGVEFRRQERVISQATRKVWVHRELDTRNAKFVINIHAFHNARLLRRYLPRHLTVPRPLYPGQKRDEHLANIASGIEETAAASKAESDKKRSETLAKNRANKEAAQAKAKTAFEPQPR